MVLYTNNIMLTQYLQYCFALSIPPLTLTLRSGGFPRILVNIIIFIVPIIFIVKIIGVLFGIFFLNDIFRIIKNLIKSIRNFHKNFSQHFYILAVNSVSNVYPC